MKMGKHFEKPKREFGMKRMLMLETAIALLGLMVYGTLQAYAKNQCAEYRIPDAVYSIPTGVSCKVTNAGTQYLIPLDKVREMFQMMQDGNDS